MNLVDFFISHNIILTAILAFGLGVWVYLDNRKDVRNLTLSAMLVTVSLWSFSLILWRQSSADWQADFWIRTAFLIGNFLPVLFLFFAYATYKNKLPPLWMQGLALLPSIVFGWSIYATSSIICGTEGGLCFGFGKTVLAAHFAVFVVFSLILFLMSAKEKNGLDHNKLAAVLVGTVIAFDVVFAAMFASSSFSTESSSVWVGNIALLIGIFIITASVTKRQLLIDLRLVSIEIFILIALAIVVADLVIAEDLVDFTMRLVILLLLVFYGIFTIRSMVREVRQMRKMNQMMEQLTKINGRLLETDKIKTQLVSFASHQLRAPVSGIRSYLDMLSRGDFGDLKKKQQEIININLGALAQMSETIETFLNVAKDELGHLDLYKSETDIADVVRQAIRVMNPVATQKGLQLTLEVKGNLPSVNCDHGKVYHVFTNLIDNAIKYTEEGHVKVGIWEQGSKIRVEISDTGVGIGKREQVELFKTFKRGLAGIRLNSDGSGLGLYIVQKIIEAHGGHISVESPGQGKGSTFSFTLPIK